MKVGGGPRDPGRVVVFGKRVEPCRDLEFCSAGKEGGCGTFDVIFRVVSELSLTAASVLASVQGGDVRSFFGRFGGKDDPESG